MLSAAQALFGQQGFERTTTREIGEKAGVDAALIARYFGSKADLYIAAVVAEGQSDQTASEFEGLADVAEALLARTDERGLGPVTQALVRGDTPPEIRQAAGAHLRQRIVAPLTDELAARGSSRPAIQAELLAASLLGISLSRAHGWFEELGRASRQDLVGLITETLAPVPAGQ